MRELDVDGRESRARRADVRDSTLSRSRRQMRAARVCTAMAAEVASAAAVRLGEDGERAIGQAVQKVICIANKVHLSGWTWPRPEARRPRDPCEPHASASRTKGSLTRG